MPVRELCSKYIKERLQARTFDPRGLFFLANNAVLSLVLLTKSKKFSSNFKAGVKLCLLHEIDSHLKKKKKKHFPVVLFLARFVGSK